MSWRGVFAGALVLIALEAVLRSEESADRFGELFTTTSDLVAKFMSPTVAAIPNLGGPDDDTGGGGSDDDGGGFSGGSGGGSGGGSSW